MFDPRFTRWRRLFVPEWFRVVYDLISPVVHGPGGPFKSLAPKPKRRKVPSSRWRGGLALYTSDRGQITGVRVEVLELQTPLEITGIRVGTVAGATPFRETGVRVETVARETPYRMTGIRVQLVVPIMPTARIGKLRNYAL